MACRHTIQITQDTTPRKTRHQPEEIQTRHLRGRHLLAWVQLGTQKGNHQVQPGILDRQDRAQYGERQRNQCLLQIKRLDGVEVLGF